MASETIPRGIADPHYRYKMPAIITKDEGKGNGRTVISNLVDVAKSLARPPSYPIKFFGFELGAITSVEHNKYSINGTHARYKLVQALDSFIDKFVICKKCHKNPETYVVINDQMISLLCKSCGGRTPVDMSHKLSSFIVKNPPPPPPPDEIEKIMQKVKEMPAVAKKKGGKGKKNMSKEENDDGADDDNEDGVVWHTDTSHEAAEQRRKQMLSETSELTAKLLSAAIEERPDPLVSMHAFLAASPAPSPSQILSQLKQEKEEYKLDDEQLARLAFLALFDSHVYAQIQEAGKLEVIKQVVTGPNGQAGILAGLTELGKKDEGVQKAVPHVLKQLYEEEVLNEVEIKKWHDAKSHGDAKQVRRAAAVFMEWLKTAEEEESEEEDD